MDECKPLTSGTASARPRRRPSPLLSQPWQLTTVRHLYGCQEQAWCLLIYADASLRLCKGLIRVPLRKKLKAARGQAESAVLSRFDIEEARYEAECALVVDSL